MKIALCIFLPSSVKLERSKCRAVISIDCPRWTLLSHPGSPSGMKDLFPQRLECCWKRSSPSTLFKLPDPRSCLLPRQPTSKEQSFAPLSQRYLKGHPNPRTPCGVVWGLCGTASQFHICLFLLPCNPSTGVDRKLSLATSWPLSPSQSQLWEPNLELLWSKWPWNASAISERRVRNQESRSTGFVFGGGQNSKCREFLKAQQRNLHRFLTKTSRGQKPHNTDDPSPTSYENTHEPKRADKEATAAFETGKVAQLSARCLHMKAWSEKPGGRTEGLQGGEVGRVNAARTARDYSPLGCGEDQRWRPEALPWKGQGPIA